MNERPLKIRRRRLTRFVGATIRRAGDCMSWRLVTLTLIRAANTEPLKASCKVSNVSFKIRVSLKFERHLFAALDRLGAGDASQSTGHVSVRMQHDVTLKPCAKFIKTVFLKAAHALSGAESVANPLFRSLYLPQTIARCAQYQCRWIAESSFNSFIAGQQLPFR